jgi:cystathionine gamma-lyase
VVRYPGLASHPAHALARRQMTSGGALIALTLADEAAAERFIASCAFLRPATSFGGVHSSAERRARWGDAVAPGFIRLSVGCEPTEVLWAAIDGALRD